MTRMTDKCRGVTRLQGAQGRPRGVGAAGPRAIRTEVDAALGYWGYWKATARATGCGVERQVSHWGAGVFPGDRQCEARGTRALAVLP